MARSPTAINPWVGRVGGKTWMGKRGLLGKGEEVSPLANRLVASERDKGEASP